ncbi:hypothetical protein JYU34_022756, partial [Plutella xylostella]
ALDKLAEAQAYFNKNNPNSVELENVNQLYNLGVAKLESAFEELLARLTRVPEPAALLDMIALDDDSSVESVSVGSSGGGGGGGGEALRAAAAWLAAAGRPPAPALVAVRAPALTSALNNLRDYLRTSSMAASPLMRTKNILNRSDSTKKTNKISKALEKRATKIMWKASQTLEQSTGLALGPRRAAADADVSMVSDGSWAEALGALAAAAVRLARAEQRFLLALLPLPRLHAAARQLLAPASNMLLNELNTMCMRWRRGVAAGAGGAAGWWLLARLARLRGDVARLAPEPPPPDAPFAQLYPACQAHCLSSLEQFLCVVRADGGGGARDGTVHQLAPLALHHVAMLAAHLDQVGAALATDPQYAAAAAQLPHAPSPHHALLAVYMRKVLAQLNASLRAKSEAYGDALRAVFLLNNTLYLLQGLQREGLVPLLALAEPDCERNLQALVDDYKQAYLDSWNKLVAHTVLEEPLPARLRDKDRQMLKDKLSAFNRELEEATRAQRGYAVPDAELREALKRGNKQALLPRYEALHAAAAASAFSKHPDKYLKYTPQEVAAQLDSYFDEAA